MVRLLPWLEPAYRETAKPEDLILTRFYHKTGRIIFPVLIDPALPFEERVRLGNYRRVLPEITAENFPVKFDPSAIPTITLVDLLCVRGIIPDYRAATDFIRGRGCLPGGMDELLALGMARSLIRFKILALGGVDKIEDAPETAYTPCGWTLERTWIDSLFPTERNYWDGLEYGRVLLAIEEDQRSTKYILTQIIHDLRKEFERGTLENVGKVFLTD